MFDLSVATEGGCGPPTSTQLVCQLATLDSVVLAGMGGEDSLEGDRLPELDHGRRPRRRRRRRPQRRSSASEDVLVDGPDGAGDVLTGFDGDDALLHNDGPDQLLGGNGNDLFLSVSICDGEVVRGESGRDNSSWARMKGQSVGANLGTGSAGQPGAGGTPACGAGNLDSLQEIEDLEGSEAGDAFYGDAGPNQLLGHKGPDTYSAAAGADTILANSAVEGPDFDPLIDCGPDVDGALVDRPQYGGDAAPVNCEAVVEADPNSFQLLPDFPLPTPPFAEPAPPVQVVDRKPPRTRVLARPRPVLVTDKARRRVVFRFASSESGSRFRCKLDRKPFRSCASPRVYLLALGAHALRIVAVDRSGNADPSPALIKVKVRRRG